jgi:hypothetical protein
MNSHCDVEIESDRHATSASGFLAPLQLTIGDPLQVFVEFALTALFFPQVEPRGFRQVRAIFPAGAVAGDSKPQVQPFVCSAISSRRGGLRRRGENTKKTRPSSLPARAIDEIAARRMPMSMPRSSGTE